jgi:hypothetical protein
MVGEELWSANVGKNLRASSKIWDCVLVGLLWIAWIMMLAINPAIAVGPLQKSRGIIGEINIRGDR